MAVSLYFTYISLSERSRQRLWVHRLCHRPRDGSMSLFRMTSLVMAVLLNIHFIQLIFGFSDIGRKFLSLNMEKSKMVK